MLAALQTAGYFALWVAVILQLPLAVRDKRSRLLWIVLALWAVETTLYRTAVQEYLQDTLNGHVAFLGRHLFSVIEAAGLLYLLIGITSRTRLRFLAVSASGAVAAIMVTIYVVADPIEPRWGESADIPLTYWHILSVFHSATHVLAAGLCWSTARRVRHWTERVSLTTLGVGMLLACIPWGLNFAWLITEDDRWIDPIGPIDSVTGLCIALSAAPVLALAARRSVKERRAYRQLGPLWRDLTSTVTGIVLDGPGPRSTRFALTRRCVEIRDAMLALRNYATETAVRHAERYVGDRGLADDQRDAAITACWLAAARNAKRADAPALVQPRELLTQGGHDLDGEVNYLVTVAQHYHSPLVQGYLKSLEVGVDSP